MGGRTRRVQLVQGGEGGGGSGRSASHRGRAVRGRAPRGVARARVRAAHKELQARVRLRSAPHSLRPQAASRAPRPRPPPPPPVLTGHVSSFPPY